MTQVTITLNTDETLLGVFLHRPGPLPAEPLPGARHSVTRDLPDGMYHVAVAGTGLTPGEEISVKFATSSDSVTRGANISDDGTFSELFPFRLIGQDVR